MSKTATACPACADGTMVPETVAEVAQDKTGARVAVITNVPRHRCPRCGHYEVEAAVAILVGGHLGDALKRNVVTVSDWPSLGYGQ